MDRFDAIESSRFLGAEFLTWLWFKIDLFEGHLDIPGASACEAWFSTQMVLAAWPSTKEKVTVRSENPTDAREAVVALRQGKVPVKAGLCLSFGNQGYSFTVDGPKFALSSVKLPAVTAEDEESHLTERMRLLEDLDQAMRLLFGEFVCLRLSTGWDSELAPAISKWVAGKRGADGFTKRKYQAALKRAQAKVKIQAKPGGA